MIVELYTCRYFSTTGVKAAGYGSPHTPGTIAATIHKRQQKSQELARKDHYDQKFDGTSTAVQIQDAPSENVFNALIVGYNFLSTVPSEMQNLKKVLSLKQFFFEVAN